MKNVRVHASMSAKGITSKRRPVGFPTPRGWFSRIKLAREFNAAVKREGISRRAIYEGCGIDERYGWSNLRREAA